MQELRELDDRCEYLQRTYQSLRQGRKSLHERMISYLRSPHMTSFSRESILKQEETLADIDNSIDDWIRKSEQAENRRSRVRQKLLEHVAAALTLRPNTMTSPRHVCEQQTLRRAQSKKINSLTMSANVCSRSRFTPMLALQHCFLR